MTETPGDIRATASAINKRFEEMFVDFWPIWDNEDVQSIIAGALMAERERAAKIAEGYTIPGFDGLLPTSEAVNSTALKIAEAIRFPTDKAEPK